jgi:hypothetical protein
MRLDRARVAGYALSLAWLACGLLIAATQLALADEPPPGQPATGPAEPPVTYNAISDTKYYPKPALPKIGPAGFLFKDPTFGCPMLRVSDEKTLDGRSIVTPATGYSNSWNADSTIFCVLADGSANVPFRFDPKTMTASRIKDLSILPDIGNEITFSHHDPNICYGKSRERKTIVQFDFSTNKATDLVDVGKLTGLEVGYMGTLSVSADDVLALIFGGGGQDQSPYTLIYDIKTHKHLLWNTKDGTVDGKALDKAPRFTQHSGVVDLSGRYFVTLGPGVQGPVVWDIKANQVHSPSTQKEGHYTLGYGEMINYPHKWVLRSLEAGALDSVKDLMEHPAGEPYFAYDAHESWNNARSDKQVPVLASTYHPEERGDAKCAWGDEVIAIATDGSKKVWRFAHNRSTVHVRGDSPQQSKAAGYNFWDSPRGNVSADGRFYMFTSNWEETVGKDSHGRVREDVFVVKLERDETTTAPASPSR